jgi:hypothetical protein
MPKADWSCPHCGNLGEPTASRQLGSEISPKGSVALLSLFVIFPVLLFLLHIFFPNL